MKMRTTVVWFMLVAVLAAGCGDDNKNPVAPSPVVEERTSLGMDGIDTSMQTASWGRPHVGEAGIDFGGRTSFSSTPSTQIGEAGIDFGGRTSFSSTQNGCTPDAGVVASLDAKLLHWPTVGRSDLVAVGNHAKTAFETQMTRYDFFAAVEADPNTQRNGVVKTSTWQGWSNPFWTSVLDEIDRLVECSLTPQNSLPSSVSISVAGDTATCTANGGNPAGYTWTVHSGSTGVHNCGDAQNGCSSNTITASDLSSLGTTPHSTVRIGCTAWFGGSRRDSSEVSWTIPGPNRAPVTAFISAKPKRGPLPTADSVRVGSKLIYALDTHFEDPDGDTLTYTANSGDTSKLTVAVANGLLTATPVAVGTSVVSVVASDGNLFVTDTVTITVLEARKPYHVGATAELTQNFTHTSATLRVVWGTKNWAAGGNGISCWRLKWAGSQEYRESSLPNDVTAKGEACRLNNSGTLGQGVAFATDLGSPALGLKPGLYALHALPCKVAAGIDRCTEWEDRYPGWDYTHIGSFRIEPEPTAPEPEPSDSLPTSVWVERNGAGYVGYSYLRCRTKGGRGNFRYAWQAVEGNGSVNHTICDLNAPKGELRNGLPRCERDWTATTLGGALPANREYKFSCRAILDNSTYTDYSPGVPWTLKNPDD